ncbi:phosphoribosyl pyrophosphokinase [Terfezia boudieri ATCC MYA-4762]|uniref:Phosphoribosyl pyrophosphokinase n=1 Tax=Terfezia boudieri ATCC MYA-4762 TaxID=1051890 RepID=A0A3N4LCN8_9PEZI|nr:phosphoribosyl pyrophosphokinase [Terfezia boudieri ATCC MYA-4762]
MVRNIVVLGGSSHPQLAHSICVNLGIPPGRIILSKFAVGETRVEIQDSVRGKDVFILQSGCGRVNDHLMELFITISACKTASAKRVTVVLPLFPYSRQPDIPYNKLGAPLSKAPANKPEGFTFESRPATPRLVDHPMSLSGPSAGGLENRLTRLALEQRNQQESAPNGGMATSMRRTYTSDSVNGVPKTPGPGSTLGGGEWLPGHGFKAQAGYKQWVAQAGTLIADLLTCAGADHVITMDLHDPQYQGFFDIPVDNLYGRPLLQKYIQYSIPDYQNAVIVSPDAGGAKRATAIADALGMEFALIHKERRPTRITDRQNATMMLVGDIAGKVAILVDDLADTSNTITRAAKLLKNKGKATKVYALVTHGLFSGDAIDRINASALDKVVVTNTVPQHEHQRLCNKLEVLDVGGVFAEAVRRVHHGESISVLFRYD